MIEAFPLNWPLGFERTKYQKDSRFKVSFAEARDGVIHELRLMGAKNVIVSTNIPLKRDGLPYASFSKLTDTGVAVYFTFMNEQRVFACDKWKKVEDNMQAVRKSINAIRMLPDWGVSEMLKRTFSGFKALPEQVEKNEKAWFEILEVPPNANAFQIKEAFRKKVMIHHPDRGGSSEIFNAISVAYQQGLAAIAQ